MSQYDSLSVDPELAAKVSSLFRTGMWPSRRALYHDLIRRGLMEILSSGVAQASVSLNSLPQSSGSVPAAPPKSAGASREASGSHRPRGRRVRTPRPIGRALKEDIEGAGSPAEVAHAQAAASTAPNPDPSSGDVSRATPASAPKAQAVIEPTWVCPACGGMFPLEERWVHKPKCAGRTSAAPDIPPRVPSPPQAHPPPGPGIDLDRLRGRVLDSLRDAVRSINPRGYLLVLVQRVLEEQGLPELPEADAVRIVQELARREPAIERVLGRPLG